uniref:Uncharacterized protein n=1 Tax=blood disease bacterium R229 TaxID=741978 RepID=G2ZPL3_9RALS|nr:conserved hypothetical protein [blood disease bacterium R229]
MSGDTGANPRYFLVVCLAISGCSQRNMTDSQFTLSSGVKLVKDTQCSTTPATTSLASRRATNSHQVSVTGYFACQSQLEPPFLTMDNEGKVTLVLVPRRHFLEFASTCECSRSMTIDISGRLTAGQTLYVLNDREVVGHVVVP